MRCASGAFMPPYVAAPSWRHSLRSRKDTGESPFLKAMLVGVPSRVRRLIPGVRAGSPSTDRAAGDPLDQAHLAEDRHGVGVDVLALDHAVLEGDHIHAVPLDALAGRLSHDLAAAERLDVRGRCG